MRNRTTDTVSSFSYHDFHISLESDGNFYTVTDTEQLSAATWLELRKQLDAILRAESKREQVPAYFLDYNTRTVERVLVGAKKKERYSATEPFYWVTHTEPGRSGRKRETVSSKYLHPETPEVLAALQEVASLRLQADALREKASDLLEAIPTYKER